MLLAELAGGGAGAEAAISVSEVAPDLFTLPAARSPREVLSSCSRVACRGMLSRMTGAVLEVCGGLSSGRASRGACAGAGWTTAEHLKSAASSKKAGMFGSMTVLVVAVEKHQAKQEL